MEDVHEKETCPSPAVAVTVGIVTVGKKRKPERSPKLEAVDVPGESCPIDCCSLKLVDEEKPLVVSITGSSIRKLLLEKTSAFTAPEKLEKKRADITIPKKNVRIRRIKDADNTL